MIQLHSETLWLKTKNQGEKTGYRKSPRLASMVTSEAIEVAFVREIIDDPRTALQLARVILDTPEYSVNEELRRLVAESANELLSAATDPQVFSFAEATLAQDITYRLRRDSSAAVREESAEAISAWSQAA